jgi:hypothetical protein
MVVVVVVHTGIFSTLINHRVAFRSDMDIFVVVLYFTALYLTLSVLYLVLSVCTHITLIDSVARPPQQHRLS